MPLQFTVLASGSGGNASLIQANGFGLLVDAGLGPRQLARRLTAVGASWNQIHAVLLTHTHCDHWRDKTLVHLCRQRIPLYCHAQHHDVLLLYGAAFASLQAGNLVRGYDTGEELALAPGLRCRPLPLRHDGGATFGFRFEASRDLLPSFPTCCLETTAGVPKQEFGNAGGVALGYVADLGSWDGELARALADVDLLALEFNHDVDLEYASGRSPSLIARILGEEGHLSNAQAVALLQETIRLSSPGRPRQVVQLHLSRECNRPALAAEAARTVLIDSASSIQLYTSSQHEPGPTLVLGVSTNGCHRPRRSQPPGRTVAAAPTTCAQPWLPGFDS